MKQIWKCNYCFETNESPNIIATHELKCSFNPANKKCWTCKSHSYFDGFSECIRKDINHSEFYDIFDGDEICDKWEQK